MPYTLNYNNVNYVFNNDDLQEFQFCVCLLTGSNQRVKNVINKMVLGRELTTGDRGAIGRITHPDQRGLEQEFILAINDLNNLTPEQIATTRHNAFQFFERHGAFFARKINANIETVAKFINAYRNTPFANDNAYVDQVLNTFAREAAERQAREAAAAEQQARDERARQEAANRQAIVPQFQTVVIRQDAEAQQARDAEAARRDKADAEAQQAHDAAAADLAARRAFNL
jgi:hypothetical protein